ncbi:MAG TPA: hypothetical protein VF808_10490 [Ktedonobacterales bacterium]
MADPQYASTYQSYAPAAALAPYRRSFLGDVAAGALYGDFAQDLRIPGALTQIVLSFLPLIGTLCAVRDLVADMRHRDRVGIVLNFFALAPVLGGVSKTLEVLRAFAHVGHAYRVTRRSRDNRRAQRA